MATPTPPGTTGMFQTAVGTVRDTAKWVLTSLAGVGALLVAGIGLSSLANVHSATRLVLAAVAVLVALGGVAWGISQTARVLAPSRVNFSDIVAAEKCETPPACMADIFARKEVMLEGFSASFEGLAKKFTDSRLTRAKALEASYRAPADKALETKAQAAVASFDMYRGVTERIVSNAAYNEIRTRLSPGRQLTAGLIVALGVATFAVLVAWPDSPDPAADFHGAVLTGVNLNGTRLEGASFRGMTLTGIGLEQANLDKADFASTKLKDLRLVGAKTAGANFNGATFVNVVCPDGTNSDVAGGTCVAHEGPPAKSGP